MRNKIAVSMLSGILVFSMLAGCGASTSSESDTDNSKEASSTEEGGISGQLTFVHCEGNDKPGFQQLIADFEEAYPNIEIEASYMVNSELKKQMQINMLANNMPDIVVFDSPDFATFAANGYLLDITEQMDEWGELENFYEGPLNSVTYKDRIYGLPWYSNNLALYYNKAMLEEAGVEPPATWEELEAACEKLTKDGVYGFGMALPKSEVGTFQYMPWLYSAGGDISDLTSDAAVKALDFITELVEKGYMSKECINWAHGDLEKAFIGEKVAMIEFGSWGVASLDNGGADFEWGVVPLPVDQKPVTILGGYDVGISKDCENVEAAMEFLKFIGSAEQVSAYAESIGNIPVRKDVMDNPMWEEEPIKTFVDQMENSVSRVNPFWPDLSANVQTAIQKAVTGESSAKDALNEAEEKNKDYWQ